MSVARVPGLSSLTLLGRSQRQALVKAVPSSAERDESKYLLNLTVWSKSLLFKKAIVTSSNHLNYEPLLVYHVIRRCGGNVPTLPNAIVSYRWLSAVTGLGNPTDTQPGGLSFP